MPATVGQWRLVVVFDLVQRLGATGTKATLTFKDELFGPLWHVSSVFAERQPEVFGEGCRTLATIAEGRRFGDLLADFLQREGVFADLGNPNAGAIVDGQ